MILALTISFAVGALAGALVMACAAISGRHSREEDLLQALRLERRRVAALKGEADFQRGRAIAAEQRIERMREEVA